MPAQKYLARCVALKEINSNTRRAVGSVIASNDFMMAPDEETSTSIPSRLARSVKRFCTKLKQREITNIKSTYETPLNWGIVPTKQGLLGKVNRNTLRNGDIS